MYAEANTLENPDRIEYFQVRSNLFLVVEYRDNVPGETFEQNATNIDAMYDNMNERMVETFEAPGCYCDELVQPEDDEEPNLCVVCNYNLRK